MTKKGQDKYVKELVPIREQLVNKLAILKEKLALEEQLIILERKKADEQLPHRNIDLQRRLGSKQALKKNIESRSKEYYDLDDPNESAAHLSELAQQRSKERTIQFETARIDTDLTPLERQKLNDVLLTDIGIKGPLVNPTRIGWITGEILSCVPSNRKLATLRREYQETLQSEIQKEQIPTNVFIFWHYVLDYLLRTQKTEFWQLMKSQKCDSFQILLDFCLVPEVNKFLYRMTGEAQDMEIAEQMINVILNKLFSIVSVPEFQREVVLQLLDLMNSIIETSMIATSDGSLYSPLAEKVATTLPDKFKTFVAILGVDDRSIFTLTLKNINQYLKYATDESKAFLTLLSNLNPFIIHVLSDSFEMSKTVLPYSSFQEINVKALQQRKEISSNIEAIVEYFTYIVKYENNWEKEFKEKKFMQLLWECFFHFENCSILSSYIADILLVVIEKGIESLLDDLMGDCVEFVVHNTSDVEMEGCCKVFGSNVGYMIKLGKAIAHSGFFVKRLKDEDWWHTFVESPMLKNLDLKVPESEREKIPLDAKINAIDNEISELQKLMNPDELKKEKRAKLDEERKRREEDKKRLDQERQKAMMMFAPKAEERPPVVDAYGYAHNGYYYGHCPPARQQHNKDPQYRVDNRYHRSDPRYDRDSRSNDRSSTKDKIIDYFKMNW